MSRKRGVMNKGGFTLVELLVVISIIALLASILMPALSEARGQAMIATCSNNLHTNGIAVLQYSSAHGMDRPFLFCSGTGQGAYEDEYGEWGGMGFTRGPNQQEPANPPLALCHPYGDQAFEWFLDGGQTMFCFANPLTYEVNYVYHPQALEDDPMPRTQQYPSYMIEKARAWGTYRYAYQQIPGDEDPYTTHTNSITTTTPKRARNVVMHDWATDDSQFSHYNMLQVDASVTYAGGSWEDLEYYLYGDERTPYGS